MQLNGTTTHREDKGVLSQLSLSARVALLTNQSGRTFSFWVESHLAELPHAALADLLAVSEDRSTGQGLRLLQD